MNKCVCINLQLKVVPKKNTLFTTVVLMSAKNYSALLY